MGISRSHFRDGEVNGLKHHPPRSGRSPLRPRTGLGLPTPSPGCYSPLSTVLSNFRALAQLGDEVCSSTAEDGGWFLASLIHVKFLLCARCCVKLFFVFASFLRQTLSLGTFLFWLRWFFKLLQAGLL